MKQLDREKVIEGLEKVWDAFNHMEHELYADYVFDALALLKKQGAVEPFHRCIGKDFSLIEDSHFDYCPYCGKPITWAKQEGR